MSNFHTLWQQQCAVWIQSINRNRMEGSIAYDFDQHRLTLVPRSCFQLDARTIDIPYTQLKPLISIMEGAQMDYEIKLDASMRSEPRITIDRVHIYLDGAEAITQLALIAEPEVFRLRGGLRLSI